MEPKDVDEAPQAGGLLTDEELDAVAGGQDAYHAPAGPPAEDPPPPTEYITAG